MTDYPLKIRWHNDGEALNKFLTREIGPLIETPEGQRDTPKEDLDLVAECVADRQKTNIVIENEREHRLVLEKLQSFAGGIGHPSYGGKWADRKLHNAVQRRINQLEEAL